MFTDKPNTDMGKEFAKDAESINAAHNLQLENIDKMLSEEKYSLKKKIFSLPKMEVLVHGDPKLSSVYDDMAINGQEKFGYHYNETIMNIIFNEYVLDNVRYLQKYKLAVPKLKKRRDKSAINKLRKDLGGKEMTKLSEMTDSGSSGQYSTTSCWSPDGKPKQTEPMVPGGIVINENYLTDPTSFKEAHKLLMEMEDMDEVAKSKAQQRFFGMVRAAQKGELENPSKKVADAASSMTNKSVKDYASTKTDKLPEYVDEDAVNAMTSQGWATDTIEDNMINENQAQYADIVFLQDSEAQEPLSILSQQGPDAAIEYLTQWDNGTYDDVRPNLNAGTNDQTYQNGQYVLVYNPRIGYIGLNKIVGMAESILDPDPTSMANPNKGDSMKLKPPIGGYGDDTTDVEPSSIMEIVRIMNENVKSFIDNINEERKPSSLVDLDRLKKDNVSNFESDMSNSTTAEIANAIQDVEDSEKSEFTEVGKDPQKLGLEIENAQEPNALPKKDIPKTNETNKDKEYLDVMLNGLHSVKFDEEPNAKYEERMKKDMGYMYDVRQKQKEAREKEGSRTYNKDPQPVKIVEGYTFYAKYINEEGKTSNIKFNISETIEPIASVDDSYTRLVTEGIGNAMTNDMKVDEVKKDILETFDFWSKDGMVYATKKGKIDNLNETIIREKNGSTTDLKSKMDRLISYDPSSYQKDYKISRKKVL